MKIECSPYTNRDDWFHYKMPEGHTSTKYHRFYMSFNLCASISSTKTFFLEREKNVLGLDVTLNEE